MNQKFPKTLGDMLRYVEEGKLDEDLESGNYDNVARALLLPSNLRERVRKKYVRRINQIGNDVKPRASNAYEGNPGPLETARTLFDFLWSEQGMDIKYESDTFSLKGVLDTGGGNCLGITQLNTLLLLYLLGKNDELEVSVLDSLKHCRNRIKYNGKTVEIENTRSGGFNVNHRDEEMLEYPAKGIVSVAYAGFGSQTGLESMSKNVKAVVRNYEKATKLFEIATRVLPKNLVAYGKLSLIYLNLASLKGELGHKQEARGFRKKADNYHETFRRLMNGLLEGHKSYQSLGEQ